MKFRTLLLCPPLGLFSINTIAGNNHDHGHSHSNSPVNQATANANANATNIVAT